MKKSLLTLVLLTAGALPADVFTSPNGRVACDFALRDGVPVAVVSYDGRRVFESELGFNRAKLEVLDTATRTVKGAWKPVWGFKAEYPENYVEQTVRLKRPGAVQTDETLELRCYDEGVAVRAKVVVGDRKGSLIVREDDYREHLLARPLAELAPKTPRTPENYRRAMRNFAAAADLVGPIGDGAAFVGRALIHTAVGF